MAESVKENINALCEKLGEFISSKTVAGGMGAKVAPNAVIAIVNGNVQLINIKNQDALNKIIDLAPSIANKLNFNAAFKKAKENLSESEEADFE